MEGPVEARKRTATMDLRASLIDKLPGLDEFMNRNERKGIEKALEAIGNESAKLRNEGLSRVSFCLGMINLVVLVALLARYPTCAWIVYIVEAIILIPLWFTEMVRVYNGALFILDYCWVANICGTVFMLANGIFGWSADWIRVGELCLYSAAMGPLGWAVLALHNGLIMHSIEKTASLFIHMIPVILVYQLRWNASALELDWPGKFLTESEIDAVSVWEVYVHGAVFYAGWLLLHGVWLLTVGVSQDERGNATVFGNLYEKNKLDVHFTRMFRVTSRRGHAAVYLAIHAVVSFLSFFWSMACFQFQFLHAGFIVVLFLSAAWAGAGYYEYVFAIKYVKLLHRLAQDDVV